MQESEPKLMNKQSHDHQNQSDNDEGFIPSKIIIKQKKQITIKKQTNKNDTKKQFIPRYISEGIMRKQAPQCYKRFSRFDYIQQSSGTSTFQEDQSNLFAQNSKEVELSEDNEILNTQRSKNKQKLLTPYDKFIESGDYILVYNRYKDFKFSNQQINFANNEVKLDCLRSIQQLKFKPIKPFQIIQEKSSEVLTQTMNRNGSIRQSLLQFDSKFECGNLLCAFKHKKQAHTYTFFIQNDTNTYGYNQWFYYSIKNAQTKIKYKFNIINFRKRHSFFRQGNRPVLFSLIDSKKQGKSGYSKRGESLTYGKSSIVKSYDSKQKFFQLSFDLQFSNDDDIYYISMGLPYSYSKLMNSLSIYQEIAKSNGIQWELESIGTSIAGNSIPLVTITKIKTQRDSQKYIEKINSFQRDQFPNLAEGKPNQDQLESKMKIQKQENSQLSSQNNIKIETQSSSQSNSKRIIFIIARQHPGQTWSSYMMDQMLYCLANQANSQVDYILNNFIIKCVPMINVDGVIAGNFRCDLTGMDLNRNWKNPSSLLHPQIYSIKNQIQSLINHGHTIQTCLDFHGHSKQYNVFCYSCKTDNYESRLLPYIFYQLNEQFYFPFCTFGISRYKQSTARAVIFSIIKNPNVLTVQSSFFGSNVNGKFKVFQPQTFRKMALTIFKGTKSYFSRDGHYQACKQIVKLRMSEFLQFKNQKDNILSGSDSQPSGDEIQLKEKFQKIIPKNLIEQCFEMEAIKKPIKRNKRNTKRQTLQAPLQKTSYKVKKIISNSQSKNRTIDLIKQQSLPKEIKPAWESIKRRTKFQDQFNKTSHFKKNSVIISSQTIDQNDFILDNKKSFLKNIIDREEHKLPFFSRQKGQMVPMKLKNQSFQIFRDAYNATQKHIKHNNETSLDELRNPKRNASRKLAIFKQKDQKQSEEFPLLCVLSENKKKSHVQKFKQRKQAISGDGQKSDAKIEKVKTGIQTRTQAIRQLRQKNKNSMELVSKIWRQNFTRYGMAFSTFKISK